MISKKIAFTLSEVLITMTIVGTVAALTIPTLHYQRMKKEYTAKLKNFYSKMNNAILDMELDKGSFRDLTQPDDPYDWYIDYIDPYLGHAYIDDETKTVYYKDGSSLATFFKSPSKCVDVDYDVNGDKSPNRNGFDRYRFLFCFLEGVLDSEGKCATGSANQNGRCYYFGNKDIFFGTYGGGLSTSGITRDDMITQCQNDPLWCTKLLQNDQWEFKTDYPYKF